MATPESIRRAILEGALHKAKDAVHADQIHDFEYALQAYTDSCAMLARVMDRTEKGDAEWLSMDSIVCAWLSKSLAVIKKGAPMITF